jgi:Family of unknown function (DUF6370)
MTAPVAWPAEKLGTISGGSTMKAAVTTLLGLALVFSMALVALGEEKKAEKGKVVTLKGELSCAKCTLKKEKKCTTAITVKEDGKDVVYYLDDKGNKESYHKEVCTETKAGSVKGVVSKKGDQLYIKPAKDGVKYND